MSSFEVTGRQTLHGCLTPQGAKNEALEVICATLLTKEKVTIRNVPDILDVQRLIDLLQNMGVGIKNEGGGVWTFEAQNIDGRYISSPEYAERASSIRGSILLLAPLLVRLGRAIMPTPGGDKIGRRRLDTHFLGLQKLGASFAFDPRTACYSAKTDGLQGAYMLLDEASITATANIVMAAAFAKGVTTIYNAACEPYVQQLCRMLVRMGANITGIGSNLLSVSGVGELGGVCHTLLPDMIEVGSFVGIAAMTRSEITIKNAGCEHLGIIPEAFRRIGIELHCKGDDIVVPQQDFYEIETFIDGSIMTIADSPWPGLTPDLICIFLTLSVQARGSVLIHQKMFESRLYFVDRLIDMGAQIILCDPHRAAVIGSEKLRLRPITMVSPDIRAGVALLMAAMSADGTSIIHNIEQIDRGYQNIDARLNAIGAKIKRVKE